MYYVSKQSKIPFIWFAVEKPCAGLSDMPDYLMDNWMVYSLESPPASTKVIIYVCTIMSSQPGPLSHPLSCVYACMIRKGKKMTDNLQVRRYS